MMHRVPRAAYGADLAEQLELSLPQRPWTPILAHAGGGNRSAAGEAERFTLRDEDLLEVRLRYLDHEWPDVRRFLRWARGTGQPFRWWSESADPAYYTVALERPGPNEEIRPERDSEYGAAWDLTLVLRRVEGGGFVEAYFG
jgi:hypothetical protein